MIEVFILPHRRRTEDAGTHRVNQRFRRSRSRSTITSCGTTQGQSPLFTWKRATISPTLALKLPYHGSDSSAIAASGKQIATRKYVSNPELKINNLTLSDNQFGNLKLHSSGGCPDVKGSEIEPCYSISYESPVHRPVSCTSHSSSTATLAVGRIQFGWQHN